MSSLEIHVSEAGLRKTQEVMDAVVAPWKYFGQLVRDDKKKFYREDISVREVRIPGFGYRLYACVPRDIRVPEPITGKHMQEQGKVSVAAPYLDTKNTTEAEWGTVTYLNVLFRNGFFTHGMNGVHPYRYDAGVGVYTVMPDVTPELLQELYPWEVPAELPKHTIHEMVLMCGFRRSGQYYDARTAVFTQPIVK